MKVPADRIKEKIILSDVEIVAHLQPGLLAQLV